MHNWALATWKGPVCLLTRKVQAVNKPTVPNVLVQFTLKKIVKIEAVDMEENK